MTDAYQCLDPTSAGYLCGHLVDENSIDATICETCTEFMTLEDRTRIGDGHCDTMLNVEECEWDGGERGEDKLVFQAIRSSEQDFEVT